MRHERTPTPGNLQRTCRQLAQGELPASRKSSILVLIGILTSTTERAMNSEPNPWHEWMGAQSSASIASPPRRWPRLLPRSIATIRRRAQVIRCRRGALVVFHASLTRRRATPIP
jgi:hypothetical protein